MTRLAWPLRPTAAGRLATVDTGSVPEVLQSAALLLSTRLGERIAQPDYGLPDYTFRRGGVDVEQALALLADELPGVDPVVLRDAIEAAPDGWLQQVALGLRVTEGG